MIFRIRFRWEIVGRENIPKAGPFILAPNHVTFYDSIFVFIACPRRVHFMAKQELFEGYFSRLLMTKLGGFPVRRGTSDRRAISTAISLLKEGKVVGIFFEGERSNDFNVYKPLSGAAMLSTSLGVPIIPCAIVPEARKLRVAFGRPILREKPADPAKKSEVYDQVNRELIDAVLELGAGKLHYVDEYIQPRT
ncbi:MAG TPA: 1-acyl-sn-glycerol-3-phosphate acyltransferase [Firmicutes bacterium]|nr:1-acyl-sn-glycerol-3-phosphate acyltransferase [Bacillota bacterium]